VSSAATAIAGVVQLLEVLAGGELAAGSPWSKSTHAWGCQSPCRRARGPRRANVTAAARALVLLAVIIGVLVTAAAELDQETPSSTRKRHELNPASAVVAWPGAGATDTTTA
jgi:hypothetical protein